MRRIRLGLLPKVIIAIVVAIACSTFFPDFLNRIFVTVNVLIGNFINFIIPLIIVGLIVPGIAEIGSGAGRLLGITVAIAYLSTLIAGFFSYFTCDVVYPYILETGSAFGEYGDISSNAIKPYFTVEMPPVMDVTAALILSFVLGLGTVALKGNALKRGFSEFGELITLIEDSKRDGAIEAMSVKLPYSHRSFSVPDNIYIIGTMNTADRSIAAIDTALRRRFTFIEMMPDYAVLKGVKVSDIDIAEMLKTMNERIAVLYDREHTIGHAYFMPLKNKDEPKIADLKDIFRNKILPLLQEYFYEDYGKIRLVLGDKQKGENEQFIIKGQLDYNGLFGSTDEIDLGERTDIYKINKKHLEDKNLTDVFLNPKAYIGIYDVTDVKPSESHG